jgi:hypothetical protein
LESTGKPSRIVEPVEKIDGSLMGKLGALRGIRENVRRGLPQINQGIGLILDELPIPFVVDFKSSQKDNLGI